MPIAHKVFLYWLLYIIVVVFAAGAMTLMGLPQIILIHDHSYLSLVLMVMYVFAEFFAGQQAIAISRLHRSVSDGLIWLRSHKLLDMRFDENGGVSMLGEDASGAMASHSYIASPFTKHLRALSDKTNNTRDGDGIDQHFLIEGFAEGLYRRSSIGDFIASRIVWVGIFATILGVIVAFWPFLQAGLSIEAMKNNIGGFFAGVAVAFIPTAVSFVFKIALDFNSRIVGSGVSEVIEMATESCESHVIPFLERRAA